MRTRSHGVVRFALLALIASAVSCSSPEDESVATENVSQPAPASSTPASPDSDRQPADPSPNSAPAQTAATTAAESAEEQGDHGALAMGAQLARLQALAGDAADGPPMGVDPTAWERLYIPEDNAMTPERIALGRKLYFDTRLSGDDTVACATCHDVSRGFTDQRMASEGIGDQIGRRNAPTTMNAAFFQTQFLDGRAASLEDQAKLPIANPIEMGHDSLEAAAAAIADDAAYQDMFETAYGAPPNGDDLARAIASFERTLIFLDAPFDRYLAGDEDAMSEQAKRGFALYNGSARCASCHMLNTSNPLGTDNRFHNIGIAARVDNFEELAVKALRALNEAGDDVDAVDKLALETDLSDLGRFLVTKDRADIGAFKTSQVRNVALTAPYMHDGSLATLWDVMDHYNKGGEANPFLDGGIEPLALSESEISDLVAFMFALTDDRFADANENALRQQMQTARGRRPFRDLRLANREVFPFEARLDAAREESGVDSSDPALSEPAEESLDAGDTTPDDEQDGGGQ